MIPLSRPAGALSASTSTRPRPLACTHSVKPETLIPRPAADVGTLVYFRRRISNRILFGKALDSDTREAGRRAVLVATAMLVGLGGRMHAASGMDSGKWSGTRLRMETLAEAVTRLRSGTRSFPMARYPDPILRRVAEPVAESAFQSPEDLNLLGRALEVAARTEGAVGLAASQVGVNARMIFLDQDVLGKAAPRILVNPRITERSSEGDMRWWRECCLVLPPDVLVTLLRDATVSVEYLDTMGRLHRESLEGETARALQHELDHLNGVLILDHATDDEDLDSKIFPALKSLESPEHARRQQAVFDRMGF